MNHYEHPNDGALTDELRDSLAELAAPQRPPLAAITTRGRAHQRHRLAGFAGLSVTCLAVGTALALGLTGVLGAAHARSTGTIQTASFTLASNANGTDTLTINVDEVLDAAALQRDLQRYGIPATVTSGSFCSSDPEPAGLSQVVSNDGPHRITINPANIPAGDELSFGIFQLRQGVADFFALISTSSNTCSSTPPQSGMMIAGGTDLGHLVTLGH
jgi:hypothetical protein